MSQACLILNNQSYSLIYHSAWIILSTTVHHRWCTTIISEVQMEVHEHPEEPWDREKCCRTKTRLTLKSNMGSCLGIGEIGLVVRETSVPWWAPTHAPTNPLNSVAQPHTLLCCRDRVKKRGDGHISAGHWFTVGSRNRSAISSSSSMYLKERWLEREHCW